MLPNDPAMRFVPEEAEIVEGDLCDLQSLDRFFDVPEEMEIRFPSLMTTSPAEEAEIRAKNTESLVKAVEAGLLTPEEGREKILTYF